LWALRLAYRDPEAVFSGSPLLSLAAGSKSWKKLWVGVRCVVVFIPSDLEPPLSLVYL